MHPRYFHSVLFVAIWCFLVVSVSGQTSSNTLPQLKIACVGNSITYGARIENRGKNAYPAQLQSLLGTNFEVVNFGVNGATLLKKGDRPYWETEAYQNALDFEPDMVFVKLGTNDSKAQNRIYLHEFESDYCDLINSFKNRNQNVRIVLLSPLPAFTEDSTGIWNPVIKNTIIPALQRVAYTTKSEIIDLYSLFVDRPHLLPDRVHPSGLGATVIAQRLYDLVQQNTNDFSNFYGFQLEQFKFKGADCKLVRPKSPAKGLPWVLRARFWGHEPQTDVALLERGFHIAYCDVSNLYGNQEAVDRWNSFYDSMRRLGLSKKVVLEGMSRGGLIIYNWAEQNPEKVACVYADAPVLDGLSWPGGKGKGKGSSEDWVRFKKAYHLNSEAEIDDFQDNPLHKTSRIAQGGYPMLHVCGETDAVVPIAENTIPFVKDIRAKGGAIETIYKPNNGHHPHSLKNPTPIVDFILRATNQKTNFARVAAPSAEYRSAAGWSNGTDWWTQAADIDSLCVTKGPVDLLLIGNSITQGFGNRPHVTAAPGKIAADTFFKNMRWINAGISGDRTQQVLWRLQNGQYGRARPKTVVLTIGVNNFPFESAQEIVSGIQAVLTQAQSTFIDSKIILFGPLPTGMEANSKQREKYRKVHEGLDRLELGPRTEYNDITALFLDANDNLDTQLYSGDGIHLKPEGYQVWARYLGGKLKKN
ncbi:SGNH/GDSL hydrolase family protein [Pareuzebyella sediminis]|uniref:SGNH/GDSL hydrolase family protein n=1 Tax=Pareuzebyella sediminis TaxID=2607998 RepID=UPI0018E14EC0|nr:GDSL-type esterase/lipase family protein [Pareuzebyella sediminis]